MWGRLWGLNKHAATKALKYNDIIGYDGGDEGKLETRKWQDQSGTDRYTTEVVIRQNSGRLVGLDSQDIIIGGNDLGRQDELSRIENGDMPF